MSENNNDYNKLSETPTVTNNTHVAERKKSMAKKFAEVFIEEDINEVKRAVFEDTIKPGIKRIIFDMVTGALNGILFGSTGTTDIFTGRGNKPYDYTQHSKSKSTPNRPTFSRGYGDFDAFRDYTFDSKSYAESILRTLYEYVVSDGYVTLFDYYKEIEVRTEYTDKDWGWSEEDLRFVKPKLVWVDGAQRWALNLPRPRALNYQR